MDQTRHSRRHGEYDAAAAGDLQSLLAMLDRPEDAAPIDDGLHHLVLSIAELRQRARSGR
jgi:hypothetical protein